MISFYRKLSVILLLTFLSTLAAVTQGFSLMLLLSALALFQFRHVPFKQVTFNRCELLNEVLVLLTVYAGLCFQLAFLSAGVEVVLFALVIAVNGMFLIYLAKILLGASIWRAFNNYISHNLGLGVKHTLKKNTRLRNMARLLEQAQFFGLISEAHPHTPTHS